MADGAGLKIERAAKRIGELNDAVRGNPPFSYILESDAKTGRMMTFTKRNEAILLDIATSVGEIAHHLRSAIDNTYWEIVSPFAKTDAERKRVQFPFVESDARLNDTAKQRLADRVSPSFLRSVIELRPYASLGGNQQLYLIERLNIVDKHRMLIPMTDRKTISRAVASARFPYMPKGINNVAFQGAVIDLMWNVPPDIIDRSPLGQIRVPFLNVFQKKLDVAVDIILPMGPGQHGETLIPLLYKLVGVARETISILRSSATG